MTATARKFDVKQAVREEAPLLIGLMGPPGGGKTYSALRLATGMAKVRGGDVVMIDTERRAQKYADAFKFKIVEFDPPFKPTDFLAAIKQAAGAGAGAIIVDSMSDEHEGEGGVLDWHDKEMGGDLAKSQKAWIKPKRDRIALVNGLNRIKVPVLMCFRSREKTIMDAKGRPQNIGFMPIAPAELVHAMDLTCVLPPRAEGVPIWRSDKAGEDFTIKLPNYLKPFIEDGKPLSEQMGSAFARWALGRAPDNAADPAPASSTPTSNAADDQGSEAGAEPTMEELDTRLGVAANGGMIELRRVWGTLNKDQKETLKVALDRRHKPRAQEVDNKGA